MSSLSLSCFQSTQAWLGTRTLVRFTRVKAHALLIYLAVEQDRPHRREALAGLLWPDVSEPRARRNLSQTLVELRRSLGDAAEYDDENVHPFILATPQTTAFNTECNQWTDVAAFDRAITNAAYDEAVDLYRGPFLADFIVPGSDLFESWMLTQRENLHRQALDAFGKLSIHYEQQGELEQARRVVNKLLAIVPWQEEAHRQLIRLLVLGGQRDQALAQYENCCRLLSEELDIEPEVATVALAEQIRNGDFHEKPVASISFRPVILSSRAPHLIRSRLEPQHDQHLFGVATVRTRVHTLLQAETRPWIIAIDGMGGIGKTTVAADLAHGFVESKHFANIAWVSAKKEEFELKMGRQSAMERTLDVATLTDALLAQLLVQPPMTATEQVKQTTLLHLLKAHPYLVVLDNLEIIQEQDALMPYLRQLANPSKFLLTSRNSCQTHAEVYSHTLCELSESDTLALLLHEADVRGISAISEAAPEQLMAIYQVVGGNPMALKMVVGQVGCWSLEQVLTNLKESRGKRVDELYTYIYCQAWQLLNLVERQLFLTMPLVPITTFDQLASISRLDEETLQDALTKLIQHSLVQVTGDLTERNYRLHRLTETFLVQAACRW